MKFRLVFSIPVLLATVLCLVPIRIPAQSASPQNRSKPAGSTLEGEIMDNDCAQMGSHDMTMKAESLATPDLCTLYCLHFKKTPGKYVLYNAATKTIYQLDDQNQAQFFAARKVKVTGTYDQATSTIHVADIEAISAS